MMNLTRNWWLVVVRGLLAILFGLIALFWPGLTWLVLILMFGVLLLMLGFRLRKLDIPPQSTDRDREPIQTAR